MEIMVFQALINREKNGNYGVLGHFCAHYYIRQGAAE